MRLVSKPEDGGSNPSTCAKINIMNNLTNFIISLIIDEMYNSLPEGREAEVSNMITPTQEDFDNLQEKTEEELINMGFMNAYVIVEKMNVVDESDGPLKNVWLFPTEWYKYIPEGLMVTDIMQKSEKFTRETHEDHSKFGCLSYGFTKK